MCIGNSRDSRVQKKQTPIENAILNHETSINISVIVNRESSASIKAWAVGREEVGEAPYISQFRRAGGVRRSPSVREGVGEGVWAVGVRRKPPMLGPRDYTFFKKTHAIIISRKAQ